MTDKLAYTTQEAAEQLSVSPRTVCLWIRRGFLPVVQLGGRRRIRHADLQKILKFGLPKVWEDKPFPEERQGYSRPRAQKIAS